ncbi:MAG: DNA modification methylase [Solirubrobacterales bacterium]
MATTSKRKARRPSHGVSIGPAVVEKVQISHLKRYPGNPRRGNVEAIKESLEQNGLYRPIVARRATNEVLAGNHTLMAAADLGWTEIAVTYLDCDAERAKRIVLADNRTNDLAGYDDQALVDLITELPDLAGTGYDQSALDSLLDELEPEPLVEDDVPPPPAEPQTRLGDLYELGRHRLLCEDARDPSAYECLLGDKRGALLWTDPPYGVDYEGKTKAKLRIANDRASGLEALLRDSFASVDEVLADGAPLYIAAPGGRLLLSFAQAFLDAGWDLRQTLVWVKDAMVLGRSDYHYRHEQLLYGFKPGPGRLGRGGSSWHGSDSETSVFELDRPRASREHPTMKPPELIERALLNSSRRGSVVLDPFAGSGSTLIACERTGRNAYLVELDPRYCDVVCERWERLSGKKARVRRG